MTTIDMIDVLVNPGGSECEADCVLTECECEGGGGTCGCWFGVFAVCHCVAPPTDPSDGTQPIFVPKLSDAHTAKLLDAFVQLLHQRLGDHPQLDTISKFIQLTRNAIIGRNFEGYRQAVDRLQAVTDELPYKDVQVIEGIAAELKNTLNLVAAFTCDS